MLQNAIRWVLRALMRLLFRVQVHQHAQTLDHQRLLVIANHRSFLDGLLVGLFLPMRPVFVVHTTIARQWKFKLPLMLVDYLAVDTAHPMAMKQVVRLLEAGRPVVIFPEGRITQTGSLMKVYEGPSFVAVRTQAMVLPVHIEGTERSYFSRLSGLFPRQFFPRLSLSIQPAQMLNVPTQGMARQRRQWAGVAMRRLMQEAGFAARPQQTLYGALCDSVALHGRNRRLIEDMKQQEYSYNDLLKMALMLTRLLEGHTRPGEHVGLLLPNLAPTIGLIFGLTARRRIPAMLNYTAGVDGMQAALDATQMRRIVTSRAFVEQAKLGDKLAQLQGVELLYLEDLRERISWADKLWLLLWALPRPHAFALPASSEDAAVVLFTSGSEGKPKGVVLSHRAILANIAQVQQVIDISVYDKVLNALPVFHSFGLTAGALLPVLTGASLFLYPSPLHYRIIPELAYDRGCTVLFGTSTFLGHYARFAHPYDFYRMRYVVAGAEKLSESVRSLWFEKFGLRIFEGYGATETAPVLAVNTPVAYRSNTVGNLLPGIEARLQSVPGIERGGILHVRGPNIMNGYLRAEQPGQLQPPASDFGTGWYDTGDVVDIDNEGFVHILGRVKRFAKIAGEMVSLEVAEKLALAASPQGQHAVSSQPDAGKGEALVLFTTDAQLQRQQLQAAAQSLGIAELAVPRKICHVSALPLLGTGKTDYVTLKHMAEAV